jgi:lysophospholipase L1-like esterase
MLTAHYELHNIAELDQTSGYPAPLARRVPREVADQLVNGSLVTGDCSLSEIRFRTLSGRRCAVVLTAINGGDLFVYRGDLSHNHIKLPAGQVFRHIIDWENDPLARLDPAAFSNHRFHPAVWRLVLDGPVLLHGIDLLGSRIAPPLPEQKPRLRWLAYGSSITHGYSPVTRQQCYVALVARRLGVDAINLGQSGSCFCEPEMADYIAGRDDWDVATCELGINMRNSVPPDEFARRARRLVEVVTERRPGKPLVLISPFLTGDDLLTASSPAALTTRAYEASLGDLASVFAGHGVHLLSGRDLLPDVAGLTCDLVHPSSDGHAVIAERLAARLGTIVPGLRRVTS